MGKLLKAWRYFLPILFLFVLVHFAKDITQDILKISTPLDIFGDAKEDLSGLSTITKNLYLYGLGGLSFIVEIFLLVSIPVVLKRKRYTKLEKYVTIATIFLLLFFVVATILDPRFR